MMWAVQGFCVIFNIFSDLYIVLAAIGVFKVTNTKKQNVMKKDCAEWQGFKIIRFLFVRFKKYIHAHLKGCAFFESCG